MLNRECVFNSNYINRAQCHCIIVNDKNIWQKLTKYMHQESKV